VRNGEIAGVKLSDLARDARKGVARLRT